MISDAQKLLAQMDILIEELTKNAPRIAKANKVKANDVTAARDALKVRRDALDEQIAQFNNDLFFAAAAVAGCWKRVMPAKQHSLADGIMMARFAENLAWCSSSVCPNPERFGAKFGPALDPLRSTKLWENTTPVKI